eukprot:130344_1
MTTLLLLLSLLAVRICSELIQRGIKEIRNIHDETDISVIDLSEHVQVKESFTTARNTIKYKSQQYYRGVPIIGAHLVIEDGQPVFGKYYDPKQIQHYIKSTTPVISESEALQITMNELAIKSKNDIHGKIDIKLNIYFYLNKPYLSYKIRFVYTKNNQMHIPLMIVDANKGHILTLYDEPAETVAIEACGDGGNHGTGEFEYCVDRPSLYIDTYPFVANKNVIVYDNLFYEYYDKSHAEMVECLFPNNGDQSKCYIQDPELNGAFCPACDVYAWTNVVFDLYDQWLNGSKPVSNDQIPFKAFVHVGHHWGNANYNPVEGSMNFGDGGDTWYPLTVLDVTAHEMAHGFTQQASGLIYSAESGAMNEAYSDLIGEVAKNFYWGSNDWMSGKDVYKTPNASLRYMFDPSFDGSSIDHFKDYEEAINVHASSGVYNKVFWMLNEIYNWTMMEEFKVFSYANNYYWAADSSFNDGACGVSMALHDLYGDNMNKVTSMQTSLELAFLSVGVECEIVNNTNKASHGIVCGTDRYCYNMKITPLQYENTEFILRIENQQDYVNTINDIFYTINGLYDCIDPSITFEYEKIDYGYNDESNDPAIYIINEKDENIAICGNHSLYTKECGVFETCILNYRIKNKISTGEIYRLRVIEGFSYYTYNFCPGNDKITMNAIIKLKCNIGSSSPSQNPTKEPSISPTLNTINPTIFPTNTPTTLTTNPTPYPTYSTNMKTLCTNDIISKINTSSLTDTHGIVAYCYDFNIYPNPNITTSTTVNIKNIDNNDYINWKLFYVSFTPKNYDCVSPMISFEFESIDNDIFPLYITPNLDFDNIFPCNQSTAECGVFETCLNQLPLSYLGTGKIEMDSIFNISILEYPYITAKCNHKYSINAKLTLFCNSGSASPTMEPTSDPTEWPTFPSDQPTKNPSIAPTQYTVTPTIQPTPNVSSPFDLNGEIYCNMNLTDKIISQNDIDYFYFELPYNHHFGYQILFDTCNSSYDTLLYLYNINGKQIKQNDDFVCGTSAQLYMEWIDSGPFFLGVSGCCNELHHDFGEYVLNVLCYDYHENFNMNITQNNDGGVICGNNRYCYEINMNITSENDIFEFTQTIYHNTNMTATTFDIYIQSIGLYDCYSPQITFEFERIDHNKHNKFIDLYDNNNVLLTRCGGGGIQTQCNIFEKCLTDYELDWDIIKSNSANSYKISLINSNAIESLCIDHSYTINGILTVTCNVPLLSTTTTTMDISSSISTTEELISESDTTEISTTKETENIDGCCIFKLDISIFVVLEIIFLSLFC